MSLGAKGLKGHLNGTKQKPIDPASGHLLAWIPTTPAEIKAFEGYEKDLVEWEKNDDAARQQICWNIPDSLITHLMAKTTAAEYYETLNEMKLKEGGDACAHLNKMMAMEEELASMDKPVLDKDFFNVYKPSQWPNHFLQTHASHP
ncbi:hypothetical protein BS17DRAFT_820824 [Gyrodon lividus]|nr:hypothetical protein BS17DRAFT_820824 [Gyrodon lividus]